MSIRLYADSVRCAVYEEASGGGDPLDPSSSMNRPVANPSAWLSNVKFHSDFDYYQVHSGPTSVTITHPLVPTVENEVALRPTIIRYGQVVKTEHVLINHGLPYIPRFMILRNSGLIGQSSLIQVSSAGQRRISPFATSTQIRLLDVGISGSSDLASITRTYQVIVFRNPVADSSMNFDIRPDTDTWIMGRGKWRGNLQQLRRAGAGDSQPFDIPLGRTTDISNGVSRTVLADGTTFTSPLYDGSFTGSPSIDGTIE